MNFTLLDDFLGYLVSTRGLSMNTVNGYYYDLKNFLIFIVARKFNLDMKNLEDSYLEKMSLDVIKTINKQDIYAYNSYLVHTKKNKMNAVSRKNSAIRTFFNYLTTKINVLEVDPSSDLDMPKIRRTIPTALSLEEAKRFLKTIEDYNYNSKNNDFLKSRDFCIATFFLNCGMRLSELCGIDMFDLEDDNTIKILGKGNKERSIYLNKACIHALDKYLENRPEVDSKALFLSKNKTRITPRAVQMMIDKYIVMSGLDPDKYSVHKLRHTAATLMYQYGEVDIRSLQKVLGHESVQTTEIYTHVSDEQVKRAIEKNPLGELWE